MIEVVGYMLIGAFFAMLMPILRAAADALIAYLESKK